MPTRGGTTRLSRDGGAFMRGLGSPDEKPTAIATRTRVQQWVSDLENKAAHAEEKARRYRSRADALRRMLQESADWDDETIRNQSPLSSDDRVATVIKVTSDQLGLETSKAKGRGNALVRAANAKGFTLRTLAEEIRRLGRLRHIADIENYSQSHLSLGYQGKRPVSDDAKQVVAELIGFTRWPK